MVFTYITLLIKSLLFNRFKSIPQGGGAPLGAPPKAAPMLLNLLNNSDFIINNVILVETMVSYSLFFFSVTLVLNCGTV